MMVITFLDHIQLLIQEFVCLHVHIISRVQIKFWAGKALETINCCVA
jgi:hypothetical protein